MAEQRSYSFSAITTDEVHYVAWLVEKNAKGKATLGHLYKGRAYCSMECPIALEPLQGIAFALARPNLKFRPLLLHARGQLLDAEPLRGIVTGQNQGDFLGLGG
jgi:hypothetical protein